MGFSPCIEFPLTSGVPERTFASVASIIPNNKLGGKLTHRPFKLTSDGLTQVVWNLTLITVGSIVCCVAVNGILLPQKFLGAGFTGLSLVIHYLIPSFPVSILYFVLNVPVFALGWKYVGHRFFFYSIAGLLIFSGALEWTQVSVPVHDKILAALLAGIIMGAGAGVILRSLGSAGGLDILSVFFLKRFSIRLGTTILAFNTVILVFGAIMFSLEMALYTLIYIYVNSAVVNVVVMGWSQRRVVIIISPEWQRISSEITKKINRGVTIIDGHGGFTGKDMHMLYTVIAFQELPRLKQLARDIDPNVFLVVSDTLEVMGTRIGNQPRW
ncbi:MAG: YitT family protein [Deltaproteobacteria bacterium]|nr:YitT family protein [Deltaproteobacteria bacterium]